MTTAGTEYLWFTVAIEVAPGVHCPEITLLSHGLRGQETGGVLVLRIDQVAGEWELRAQWRGSEAPAVSTVLAGEPHARRARSSLGIAEAAYGLVHRILMAEAHARGYSRLHAALVDWQGARIAIAGPSGSGKTHLALRLSAAGGRIASDEGVLLRDGSALGLPRRLHVKDSEQWPLPGPTSVAVLGYQPPVHAVDPVALYPPGTDLGHPELPLDHVVLLGDLDAAPSLKQLSPAQALPILLTEAAGYASAVESLGATRSRLVREVSVLTATTPVHWIEGHRDERGMDAIREALRGGS